ncbi:Hypp2004 [Branchiostoma lanceolatum]|uniref:Hypp2004 protein n=1 Tax=Branchiostoma lanceolatum TaxID=7740 RepID=A0A8K0ENG9_BRALA|nr:Hypp2004 [Branchiostoma lanceolatum]
MKATSGRPVGEAQCHSHGSLSGPALSIISFNTEGLTGAKQDLLAELCVINNCDILCLQETHRGPTRSRPRINGMTLIVERPHDQYGSAILARDGLNADKFSLSDMNNIEVLSIDLLGIRVSSVCKPPAETFSLPKEATDGKLNIVIGDFNSHSTTWGYRQTNDDGDLVENWADANQMSLIHDPKLPASFNSCRWRRGYNPDLEFASSTIASQCEKVVLHPIPHSQHRPIALRINAVIAPRTVPFRRRFNLKKANWDKFAEDLDLYIKDLPVLPTNYDTFVKMIKKSSRQNIPRGCRTKYIPGLNEESKTLYDEYVNRFESDPFSAETLECGDLLTSIITESRQRRWREFVESTDLTHSSRKAWKTIRILGNDYTKAQPVPQVTADQVAHQLLVNSQGNPNHHPPRAKLPKADATISEGTSHFTRPFSMDDLRNAIKDMKNNKAAGLDDILCEQIKHFGPLALQWLLDMLNQSLSTNRIPKIWRKSRVIALLKPGKDPSIPKNYRPISLLCHTYKLFERLILNRIAPLVDELLIPEQAGFRPGKSCTGQLLNLTQYIEDGYEKGLITGAVFVDLSAAYDTVNHRILTKKLFEITKDVRLTELIQNLLSNRRFFVDLNGNRSRWRRQKNGLPQGSVLAPMLFNIYTNDQPVHPDTRRFLFADDLSISAQGRTFKEVETTLSNALTVLTPYYAANHLRANPDKTQMSVFHLKNREANRQLRVCWQGKWLSSTSKPVYLVLGVTLDRTLSYKNHILNTKMKVGARNNILKKLANTHWGADASTVRATALGLCFSTAEYAAPVWCRSTHTTKLDPVLNSACRAVSGCLRPTRVDDLYLLCGIAPPHIRRAVAAQREKLKQESDPHHVLYQHVPPQKRLKSRHSFLHSVEPLRGSAASQRTAMWSQHLQTAPHELTIPPRESLPPGGRRHGQPGYVSTASEQAQEGARPL